MAKFASNVSGSSFQRRFKACIIVFEDEPDCVPGVENNDDGDVCVLIICNDTLKSRALPQMLERRRTYEYVGVYSGALQQIAVTPVRIGLCRSLEDRASTVAAMLCDIDADSYVIAPCRASYDALSLGEASRSLCECGAPILHIDVARKQAVGYTFAYGDYLRYRTFMPSSRCDRPLVPASLNNMVLSRDAAAKLVSWIGGFPPTCSWQRMAMVRLLAEHGYPEHVPYLVGWLTNGDAAGLLATVTGASRSENGKFIERWNKGQLGRQRSDGCVPKSEVIAQDWHEPAKAFLSETMAHVAQPSALAASTLEGQLLKALFAVHLRACLFEIAGQDAEVEAILSPLEGVDISAFDEALDAYIETVCEDEIHAAQCLGQFLDQLDMSELMSLEWPVEELPRWVGRQIAAPLFLNELRDYEDILGPLLFALPHPKPTNGGALAPTAMNSLFLAIKAMQAVLAAEKTEPAADAEQRRISRSLLNDLITSVCEAFNVEKRYRAEIHALREEIDGLQVGRGRFGRAILMTVDAIRRPGWRTVMLPFRLGRLVLAIMWLRTEGRWRSDESHGRSYRRNGVGLKGTQCR